MTSDTVGWVGSGFRAVVREGAQGLGRWSSCISHTIFQPGDRDHIWKAGSREKVYEGEKKLDMSSQSCPTLCDCMERSPPGTSVHGIPQARPLDWIAIFFSKDHPNQQVTCRSPALQVDSLLSESPGKQI